MYNLRVHCKHVPASAAVDLASNKRRCQLFLLSPQQTLLSAMRSLSLSWPASSNDLAVVPLIALRQSFLAANSPCQNARIPSPERQWSWPRSDVNDVSDVSRDQPNSFWRRPGTNSNSQYGNESLTSGPESRFPASRYRYSVPAVRPCSARQLDN